MAFIYAQLPPGYREYVLSYADLDGYVPELGDLPSQFRYPEKYVFTDEQWKNWVMEAYEATQAALLDFAEHNGEREV